MKPRVAHITTIDMSLRHLLLNQLLAIQDAGYDVVGISSPGPNVGFLQDRGISHLPVTMTRSMTPLRDLRSLIELYTLLRKERFDIVHTHNPKPGLLGQVAARAAGIPVVVNTLHGFYFHEYMPRLERQFYIFLEKVAARCSDVILSQNREDITTAVTEGITTSDDIRYLGNGIDLEEFDPATLDRERLARARRELGIPPEARVVGFVGRLVREKGVGEILEAASRIAGRNVRFLFVGPIDTQKADAVTPEAAASLGVGEMCIFAGMRHDMPTMYGLMDVFVLPSYREGFPRAPMEAAAMGVPVVATDVRGCREAVADGVNGMLVPMRDADRLAEAIERLLNDERFRQTLASNGRTVAEERFDERTVFAQVLNVYDELLEGQDSAKN